MRVRRSTVESLIINLVMVKEEDKGRGCMTGHGMGGVSSWIFPDNFRNAALSPGNFKNEVFSNSDK
jgi:hypothetical protein